MKFKSLVTLLFCFVGGLLSADQSSNSIQPYETSAYHRTVEFTDYENRGELTVAAIYLNDGTVWNYSVTPSKDYLLSEIDDHFTPGKEVFIYPSEKTYGYKLFVNVAGEFIGYEVGLTRKAKQVIPMITEIEKVVIRQGGWFSSDRFAMLVTLTDGSQWQLEENPLVNVSSLEHWKAGHSVIPSRTTAGEFFLINADAPYLLEAGKKGQIKGEWDARTFPFFSLETIRLILSPKLHEY